MDMVTVDDDEKSSRFLFPDTRDSRCIMTYEEYHAHTQNLERETHFRDLCVCVLEGELTLELPEHEPHVVKAKDAAYLKAGTTHIASNRIDETLPMVVVEIKNYKLL